ncbi:uncharacterized protein LOC116129622 [Pistacia vera]|uniref:uncharacterized protein LOC116129622 n=1 Tax=Pistacia vera TaxID=55513 RepID=UPI001262B63B|nr:uncharacterized protein LOC116129622 [Pistacia vera]XP_031271208.1 uncharacterized protein LOC116129622 [Pistacia vera]XP_031271209.1 uncharacterized protein LOC116129622 [Pistacia vera]
MKLVRLASRFVNTNLSHQCYRSTITRAHSTDPFGPLLGNDNNRTSESADEFERRIFGGISANSSGSDSFFRKLDRAEKGWTRPGGSGNFNGVNNSSFMDGLDDSFDTLSDGMDGKLQRAATYFEFDPEEIMQPDYTYRPDASFTPGMTYTPKDLDIRKPGVRRFPVRPEFETSTKEVLRKADFRNVRFLANFLTEAGILIKRSMTGISAKAQRKVAREIKTARAFGLMPFTTMGRKAFVFGKTMEDLDKDYEYETYESPVDVDADEKDSF